MSALSAYRHLLRSARIAFEGDAMMFNAAQQESRKAFEQNKAVAGEAAEALVKHAKDVAIILRTNVIQGKKEGDEVYSEYSRRVRRTRTTRREGDS
jgi:complex III assembly factor LYRM7